MLDAIQHSADIRSHQGRFDSPNTPTQFRLTSTYHFLASWDPPPEDSSPRCHHVKGEALPSALRSSLLRAAARCWPCLRRFSDVGLRTVGLHNGGHLLQNSPFFRDPDAGVSLLEGAPLEADSPTFCSEAGMRSAKWQQSGRSVSIHAKLGHLPEGIKTCGCADVVPEMGIPGRVEYVEEGPCKVCVVQ